MKKNITNRRNLLNFIIMGGGVLAFILGYFLWSKWDSSNMVSMVSPTKIRILHYYSDFGLGVVIKHFLFDLLIFIFIYPSIYIARIIVSKKFKVIINIGQFYVIFFILLLVLNIIYCINCMKSIISNSIIGFIDCFLININYEIYIPALIFFIIETFNDKLINNKE